MTETGQTGRAEQAARLLREIQGLREHALAVEQRFAHLVEAAHQDHRPGARNLLHYLALRSYDLRELQAALEPLGLSSLCRTEAHALASLDAVSGLLQSLLGVDAGPPADVVGFEEGQRLADAHTEALLGLHPAEQPDPIMVTLPAETADDPGLVRDLVEAGMAIARINCAHDDAAAWRRMAKHVREAARELERPCRVEMDLAGPKLRTGPLEPGPKVVRFRPLRDLRGRVTRPARIWLAPSDAPPPENTPVSAWLPVDDVAWLETLQPGDVLRLQDARGKKRSLAVVDQNERGIWAECRRTGYVETGTKLRPKGKGRRAARVGELPPLEQSLLLRPGDTLILTAGPEPGRMARLDADGGLQPARIPISLPELLQRLRPGEPVKFDDGRIEAEVVRVRRRKGEVELRITYARPTGSRLRADKGINLPQSELGLTGLTAKDRADLDAVVELADVVGMSFVNTPDDVLELMGELESRDASLGILLKIETQTAFEQLPWLLLTALRAPAVGVMIARGDLAVEVGWERMAEVQEEILWFCEAAHVPVVWATQVLESLAKLGVPSRAEITDAAMAVRAECVMLNKGPHILEAIRTLEAILGRMREHQHKKTPRLRSLGLSSDVAPTT